jgi:DUF4097 and DUF4098 domain-containing protein YvlB
MSTPTTDQQPTAPLPQQPVTGPTPPWVPGARVIAVGVVVLVVAIGTFSVVGTFFMRVRDEVKTFTGTVTAVKVTEDVGDVRVRAGAAAGTARVTAQITDSFSNASWGARLEGTTLVVDGNCDRQGFSLFNCDVDLDLALPPGTVVQIESDTGDMRVSGAFAGVDVTSSTGDVDVRDTRGPVRVRTNTGDIRGAALGGTEADVETHTGDVRLTFGTRPEAVSARTDTGDVTVTVPDDAQPYAVATSTDVGDVRVEVPNVPGSAQRLNVETDTGDIRILYP